MNDSSWDSVLAALSSAGVAAAKTGLESLTGGNAAKAQTATTTAPSVGVPTGQPYDVISVAAQNQAAADAAAKANTATAEAARRGGVRALLAVGLIAAGVGAGLYWLKPKKA